MLCQYKNLLGVSGKGIHSYKIFNISIVDVILTIIGAYLISRGFNLNFGLVLIILFLLGIVLHRLFCVKTTIDKLIFS